MGQKEAEDEVEVVIEEDGTDNEVELTFEDDEDEVEVVIEEEAAVDLESSDSDVRLNFDESMFDSDPDMPAIDSDVQLADDSAVNLEPAEDLEGTSVLDFSEESSVPGDSDSDVKLVSSDDEADFDPAGTDPEISLSEIEE